MLKSVLTGLVAVAAFSVANSASASAATLDIPTPNVEESVTVKLAAIVDESANEVVKPKKTEEKKETIHKIKENETLSDIAKEYDTTWQRIYDKNESIDSPDIINPGDKIVIPEQDEELEARELPEPPAPEPVARQQSATQTQTRTVQAASTSAPATQRRGSSAGNTYSYGYCTWHVKNLRSDLPNNLGNANTWAARARAQGMATGSTPRVGAVAQAITGYMHVAYVTAVNGDGTITVSEMNYKGWGVVSSRTAQASAFTYIY